MRVLYLSIVLLCTTAIVTQAATVVHAETAASLTLQQALELALNANAEIAVALREREAVEGMQAQAATRPNPTLSARMEGTRSATRETFVEISQPIELGNKRASRIEAADSYYDAASAAIALKKAEIQANVMTAFYGVLAAQERLRLAESSLDVARRAREAVSKRVQAGKVSPVEETRSKIAESSVHVELAQAKGALAVSRKQLAALWGSPFPNFSNAEGSVENIEAIHPLEQLHQLLDEAPAIRQARLEIDIRQALAEVEKAKATPDIALTLGTKNSDDLGGSQAVLGLSIPLMVFNQNQGNIHEALGRVDKARAEVTALRIQLQADLSSANEQRLVALAAADLYENEILPSALSAFDAATKGFEFGKFSFLHVLDAQRTLVQAKSLYLNALLEAHIATANIKRILGEAMPRLNPQH